MKTVPSTDKLLICCSGLLTELHETLLSHVKIPDSVTLCNLYSIYIARASAAPE